MIMMKLEVFTCVRVCVYGNERDSKWMRERERREAGFTHRPNVNVFLPNFTFDRNYKKNKIQMEREEQNKTNNQTNKQIMK